MLGRLVQIERKFCGVFQGWVRNRELQSIELGMQGYWITYYTYAALEHDMKARGKFLH